MRLIDIAFRYGFMPAVFLSALVFLIRTIVEEVRELW